MAPHLWRGSREKMHTLGLIPEPKPVLGVQQHPRKLKSLWVHCVKPKHICRVSMCNSCIAYRVHTYFYSTIHRSSQWHTSAHLGQLATFLLGIAMCCRNTPYWDLLKEQAGHCALCHTLLSALCSPAGYHRLIFLFPHPLVKGQKHSFCLSPSHSPRQKALQHFRK